MKPNHIFIIGPGGVGKTTSGSLLASALNLTFVDLDQMFMQHLAPIGSYIQKYGYKKYCHENSTLFYSLLSDLPERSVVTLSSGFLVHEGMDDLTTKHQDTLKKYGITVCLLPSESVEESANVVVRRQLARGFGLEEERERRKFIERYPKYNKMGDIQIYSLASPENIANEMIGKLSVLSGFK